MPHAAYTFFSLDADIKVRKGGSETVTADVEVRKSGNEGT